MLLATKAYRSLTFEKSRFNISYIVVGRKLCMNIESIILQWLYALQLMRKIYVQQSIEFQNINSVLRLIKQ